MFVHFWVHFWPQKVDKLIALEVAKLITFKWLYVFPYLGLFGPFFCKTRTLIEKQTGTSGDKLITFWNFQCYFSVFFVGCCFLISHLFFFGFSLFPFDAFSLFLRIYLMLACYKQTRKTRRPRKQERKNESKKGNKGKKGKKENKEKHRKGSQTETKKDEVEIKNKDQKPEN